MSIQYLIETLSARGDIHHAYLLTGEREHATKLLLSFIENDLRFDTAKNPDFHHYEYESLGIDEGRSLQHFAVQKALRGKKKIFVLSFGTITREAQNALLKLFEDPKEHTHFFLIAETKNLFLPTLLSRLQVIECSQDTFSDEEKKNAKRFVSQNRAERLQTLRDYIESKDKRRMYQFLGALEAELYASSKKKATRPEAMKGLREVVRSKEFLFDRSSSPKLLLEHVAVTVPRI